MVLEHLAKITAIDPATAGRASDEVLGLVFRQSTHEVADVFAARDIVKVTPSRLRLERSLRGMVVALLTRRQNDARHIAAGRALVGDKPRLLLKGRDPRHLPH